MNILLYVFAIYGIVSFSFTAIISLAYLVEQVRYWGLKEGLIKWVNRDHS